MSMDLTCLSIYPPLPIIPKTSNNSINYTHTKYEPDSGGLSQIISTSIINSALSTNDIHALLNKISNNDTISWTVSEITKTPPVPSIIIYASIVLALFLILSLVFCCISCVKRDKYQNGKKRTSKLTQVCVCLLIFVYVLGIGDIIYVGYRINKSKSSMDDTIKEINQDIYPKQTSEHLIYLTKQLDRIDQYCVETNSILINASKSILVKAFDGVLKQKYFIEEIVDNVNTIDQHMRELSDEIDRQSTIPQQAKNLFKQMEEQYETIVIDIQIPLKEVCKYANGTDTDIDKKLLEALDIVHVQLKKLIDTINQDIINKITPWQNHMLINTDAEGQIHRYISLVNTIIIVLVAVLGGIPLIFLIFIIISRFCCACGGNDYSNHDRDPIPMGNVLRMSDTGSIDDPSDNETPYRPTARHRVRPVNYYVQPIRSKKIPSNNGPSGAVLCLMRIGFFLMMIILIILIILTGIYYILDLVLQGTCRSVHDDQPYLINFMSNKLIESNIVIGNSSDMNTTMVDLVNDCRDQIHFSRNLIEGYWTTIDNDIKEMMNTLSQQIYDQFMNAIDDIDISSDIELLEDLVIVANISNITVSVRKLEGDLKTLNGSLGKIKNSNSTLPDSLVQTTITEFKNYVKSVLESTTDSCPLPLTMIYEMDTLVCHRLGSSISGLWLSLLFCISLITIGLSIFGICVYKRLGTSSGSKSSTTVRF